MLEVWVGITWILIVLLAVATGLPIARLLGAKGPTALRIALWTGLGFMTALIVLIGLVVPLRGLTAVSVVVFIPFATGVVTLVHSRFGWLQQTMHRFVCI